MPAGGGRWGGFQELRARQLQRRVQAKDERIAALEMENAILRLKLAEYRGVTGTRRQEGHLQKTCLPLLQLQVTAQKLRQEIRELQSSAAELFRSCREQHQHRVSDIVMAVQKAQLPREALSSWQARATCLEQSLRDLSMRYHHERQTRRQLHNRLVEMKGNIRVHCRVRPTLPADGESHTPISHNSAASGEVARAVDDETVLVKCSRPGQPSVNKTFTFERVYGPAESQRAVFGDVCPLLRSLLDGYNVCVMAYGQTGSGKTHTMLGPHPAGASQDESGIIPRAVEELFRLISEDPSEGPEVGVSIVEIYNNDIFDLLAKDSGAVMSGVRREVLTTEEGKKEASPLTRMSVRSAGELLGLVGAGQQHRARRATAVHEDSSRSHLIVTVTLTAAAPQDSSPEPQSSPSEPQQPTHPSSPRPVTGRGQRMPPRTPPRSPRATPRSPAQLTGQVLAKLQLVDLAGSECAGVSGVRGPALREASCINRSLAALADVLGALSECRGHVPYRNSTLTHLLQDALGGDAKLLVILCVSPCQKHMAETLQSLGFGARARQVERGRPAPRTPR